VQTTDNVVLITGGTSGIGRAFAEQFASRGNTVIVCGRRRDRLSQLEKQIPGVIGRACDITSVSQREALASWVVTEHPQLNVLINNAGIQLAGDFTGPVDPDDVQAEVETNRVAPIHLTSLLTYHLATQKRAALINISSGLAFAPISFMPVYCATKAAIHSFTLSLRHQLRDSAIQVFEIAPPSVDTELGHQRRAEKNQSHGGMPVSEFIAAAMQALENDILEAPIGSAAGMHEHPDEAFSRMNR